MVLLSNTDGVAGYDVVKNTDGTVSIFINYNQDIQNKNITVTMDPSKSNKLQLVRVSPLTKNFMVTPNDNEMALFYD